VREKQEQEEEGSEAFEFWWLVGEGKGTTGRRKAEAAKINACLRNAVESGIEISLKSQARRRRREEKE
jgi:hypothetical protein